MFFLVLWAFGLIASYCGLFSFSMFGNLNIYQQFLLGQFAVTFVSVGIIGVIVNIIYADKMSKKLGWPGGPFQIKYGFSQFGLGLIGLLSIWYQGQFWVATLVTMYVYGLSGLWSHASLLYTDSRLDVGHLLNIIMDVSYQLFITYLSVLAGHIW